MHDYTISAISQTDKRGMAQVEELLLQEGIRKDGNLDYTAGIYDEEYRLIATGSCFCNTLRCLAVSNVHQGEGLMNTMISHLVQYQYDKGNYHIFLYTKCSSAQFFADLGFYEIVRIEGQIVFMENRRFGFSDYLEHLREESPESENAGAIVMHANPFTKGHLHLIKSAARECDALHIFAISEASSVIPYAIRRRLIEENTQEIKNLAFHDSGSYIISNTTFPSYFQKDGNAVIESHARLDLAVFAKIAAALGIKTRYVGEEPFSRVTGIYNQIMARELPQHGINCRIIPRLEADGRAISASDVRVALQKEDWDALARLVPDKTLEFFKSDEGKAIIGKLKSEVDVIHY